MSKPRYLEVPIGELRPNPWNVNSLSPETEAKLTASVKRLGLYRPIIVRQVEDEPGYEILAGEHRWQIMRDLGEATIQIVDLGYIDERTAKEIMLADNSRYGTDDVIGLAELLDSLGSHEEISSFLPYTDDDFKAIFSSVDIQLDELEIDEDEEKPAEKDPEEPIRAPKTHALMRFKVPIADGERITKLIAEAQKRFGYTAADELTNAGDALVHLLLRRDDAE